MDAGQLSLQWQDNSDNEDGFEIERALSGEEFGLLTSVGPDTEAYVDDSIVPGLEYEYRVRAFNPFGFSGYTNVSIGAMPNTPPVLENVEDVSILTGDDSIEVEFSFSDAESDAEDLIVEVVSSNLSLVSLEDISLDLENGLGVISVNPTVSEAGTTVISLFVSDGVEVSQRDFEFEIARNTAPAIGTTAAIDVYDSQVLGPYEFTLSDLESDASDLVVVGDSLDESLIASNSISIEGTGSRRSVYFSTQEGVSGSTAIRLAVSDGVNVSYGALRVNVSKNAAPVLNGLDEAYTIESGGEIDSLLFNVSDRETSSGSLNVSVRSSNSLIVSEFGLDLKGSSSQRSLEITPNPGMTGTVEITVSVEDGFHKVEHTFNLRILASEQIVKITGFTIEDRLAVVEVENRVGETFSLWKIHSLDGAWEKAENIDVVVEEASTTLIDLTPVDSAVCYRVVASK